VTQTLSVKRIVPGDNHRTNFDPVEMNKLREGIKAANGVIQPILVRPIGDGRHEIIAGYCRWLLSQEVMGENYEIPVLIRAAWVSDESEQVVSKKLR